MISARLEKRLVAIERSVANRIRRRSSWNYSMFSVEELERIRELVVKSKVGLSEVDPPLLSAEERDLWQSFRLRSMEVHPDQANENSCS